MIFPNSQNANQIPQLFNAGALSLPYSYNGAQINYRDSSWLKLSICESFLKNECPNVDNCSLAHPLSNVKFENDKVTVCYDYIKKKECKHNNCKYYHPHDVLASAILRRGDDTKKNVNSLSNFGLSLGLPNPFQMPRSQELFNLQTQNMLSSQMNNVLMTDPQMKIKLEILRQLNAGNAPHAWLPGLQTSSGQSMLTPSIQDHISLQSMISQVSSKTSTFNPMGSISSTANSSVQPPLVGFADPAMKLAGIKRAASDIFDPVSSNGLSYASRDNNVYGLPDVKKEKIADVEPDSAANSTTESDQHTYHYMTSTTASDIHLSPNHLALPLFAAGSIPCNFNSIIQPSSLQSTPFHQIGSLNVNNILLQSLLANNHSLMHSYPGLEPSLALSAQKPFGHINPYANLNMAQLPMINQLYYQQMVQNLVNPPQQLYYPNSVSVADVQPRTYEDTCVALINDKGNMLETLPVCKDFLQGKCKRNQSCNYVHLLDANVEIKDNKVTVCKNALKGQCHRSVCKFYHIPSYQLQRIGIHAQI